MRRVGAQTNLDLAVILVVAQLPAVLQILDVGALRMQLVLMSFALRYAHVTGLWNLLLAST
jgi:hypothetical protein